jgi:hypothetical protein
MAENKQNLSSGQANNKRIFLYNMSFYYQSTIIYFAAFMLYIIIQGEFVEGSFILITKDPIIYFFGIIVLISLFSLIYNLYKRKHIEISDDEIAFVNRFRQRRFAKDDILFIKIRRSRRISRKEAFRFVRIKIKNRKRPIILRPYDYENENELIQCLEKIKLALSNQN